MGRGRSKLGTSEVWEMGKVIFRGQKGFTLVDLLAVMAILGILAALVAGSIVGLGIRGQ